MEKYDSLKVLYHQLTGRVEHHVKVVLSPQLKEELERRKQSLGREEALSLFSSPKRSSSPRNLRKTIEQMKKQKEVEKRREDFLQLQIEKSRKKKQSVLHRLQEEMGRLKVDIDQAFGKDRKLCKKNIT